MKHYRIRLSDDHLKHAESLVDQLQNSFIAHLKESITSSDALRIMLKAGLQEFLSTFVRDLPAPETLQSKELKNFNLKVTEAQENMIEAVFNAQRVYTQRELITYALDTACKMNKRNLMMFFAL